MQKSSSIARRTLVAALSPELKAKYDVHSMQIRKGDTVSITRGAFRNVEGKVTQAERYKPSIYIEGVTREKSDGSTIFLPIHPSKVMITKLNLDDKWRKDILERRASKSIVENVKLKTKAGKTPLKKVISNVKGNKGEV